MLYLTGWIFYADTSINVSLSQRRDLAGRAVQLLDVPDGKGGWRTAIPSHRVIPRARRRRCPSTFPASSIARIRGCASAPTSRSTGTASPTRSDDPVGAAGPDARAACPRPSSSFAGSRGWSASRRRARRSSSTTTSRRGPRWADMAGLYTRLGDVRSPARRGRRPLRRHEGRRRRAAAVRRRRCCRRVPAGWVRDYLVVLDGWDKDADKNTVAGQTVEPLPFHGMDDARYGELAFPASAVARRVRARVPDAAREARTSSATRCAKRRPPACPDAARP